MINRQSVGKMGEDIAVDHLEKQGYQILSCNYRCTFGEIDIIALDKDELVFIEVKTRTNTNYGLPYESVTKTKQQRIRKIAIHYVQEMHPSIYNFRFDVISILLKKGEACKIEIIKNAF